jgi:hypothetical protein
MTNIQPSPGRLVGIEPPPKAYTVMVELPPGATNSKAPDLDVPVGVVSTAPPPPAIPDPAVFEVAAFAVVVNWAEVVGVVEVAAADVGVDVGV